MDVGAVLKVKAPHCWVRVSDTSVLPESSVSSTFSRPFSPHCCRRKPLFVIKSSVVTAPRPGSAPQSPRSHSPAVCGRGRLSASCFFSLGAGMRDSIGGSVAPGPILTVVPGPRRAIAAAFWGILHEDRLRPAHPPDGTAVQAHGC